MKIACTFEKMLPLSELKPHPKNRNKHPSEQIDSLAKLIKYQGIRHPIIVSNTSGFIVAGHGRLAAAKKLGLKEFPVDWQDFESEEQEYAFLQSDNAIALWSELDLAGINADIVDFGPDLEIDLLGIQNFALDPAEKFNAMNEWDGMPEFNQDNLKPSRQIIVSFKNDKDVEEFAKLINQSLTDKTRSIWYPAVERRVLKDQIY